jgi:hypothetical protein
MLGDQICDRTVCELYRAQFGQQTPTTFRVGPNAPEMNCRAKERRLKRVSGTDWCENLKTCFNSPTDALWTLKIATCLGMVGIGV